jgi:hypothetical protein
MLAVENIFPQICRVVQAQAVDLSARHAQGSANV